MTRVLILGHTGFIGRRLASAVPERVPDVEVAGLSLDDLDLGSREAPSLLAAMLDCDTTLIVLAGIKKQLGDRLDLFDRNMAIVSAVCRAIEHQPVRRVLFYSSAEVYGETTHDPAMTERTAVRPTSYYGIAKFACEGLLRKATAACGATLVMLRPPLVYGPGDASLGYGPSGFTRAAVRREPIILWGDGTERRDFLFVEDLVDATCRLAASDASGVVNVASGRSATFRDVLETLEDLVGRPLEISGRPRTRSSVDQGYRIDRLKTLLPAFQATSLEDGLRALVEHERTLITTI